MSVELKVGQVWKDRRGREVQIVSSDDDKDFPFNGSNTQSYTPSGMVLKTGKANNGDLIELVQDENGWRPWKATADSVCPVDGDTYVLVRLACGITSKEHDPKRADKLIWSNLPYSSILAYKIVQEAPKDSEPVHAEAHDAPQRTPRRHSHYFKDVSQINEIDVYRVCELFGVDDPSGATQHAVKKLLCAGQRGAKDRAKDYQEAIDTLTRRVEMWVEGQQ